MHTSWKIREIRPDDNRHIATVIRSVMKEHGIDRPGSVYTDPTTDDLYALFRTDGSAYFVVETEEGIMGGCGLYPTEGLPAGCVELVKLYLLPTLRGKGLGEALIRKCMDEARRSGYSSMYLESMPELNSALGLYERLGFRYLTHSLGNSGHYACNVWMLLTLSAEDET